MKRNKKKINESKIYIVDENKNSEKSKYSKSKINPITAQDTIPFDEVYENGIFRIGNTFSIILSYTNIDYKVKRENEKDHLYERYQHFLNTLPQDVKYQELIMNSPLDEKTIADAIIPTYSQTQFCDKAVFDDYCNFNRKRIEKSVNNSCDQIVLAAISYTPQTKLDDVNILFKYYKALADQALEFPTKISLLKPQKIFEILHKFYYPFDKEEFLLPKSFLQNDVNLKDYIAPSHFKFRNKLIEVGETYSCVMFVKRFSHECDDEFITDLLDNSYNIAVSKHLLRIDKTESLKILKRQMDDLEGRLEKRREINFKRGGDFIPYSLRSREEDLIALQNKLGGSNCDLFEFACYVYISAQSEEELNNLKAFIKQCAARHQVIIDILTGVTQQEKGLKCILPFANPVKSDDGQLLGQPFYLPTDEVANFIPFSYFNTISKTGIPYGTNAITRTPIIIDRSEGLNGNGFYLGTSGSGKSMFTKAEFFAAATKYTQDEFFIFDPENEYRPLGSANKLLNGRVPFDAEILRLSPDTNTHLNIFDTDISFSEEGSDAVTLKADFIMTFVEAAKGSTLTAKEKSVIDRCVRIVYKNFINSGGDKKYTPTLIDFNNALMEQPEKESKDIQLYIELYTSGSFNIFAHQTNIEFHKKFVIFDIFAMGNQLAKVGLVVLLEMLWQRVIENKHKGIRTWVWTDEFSIMFNNDSSSEVFHTGEFFEKVYRRIRKHGGIATGATQNISEVIQSKQAMTMLQNSEFLIFLAQKEEDLSKIKTMFNLSESQAKYLDTDEYGKGLIKVGKRIIPFENEIPNDTLMYKICSTKFKDIQKTMQG